MCPLSTTVSRLRLTAFVFNIEVKSPLDPTFNDMGRSSKNRQMLKVQAGTIGPGEVLVYAGIDSNNNSDYSAPGPAEGFWQTSGTYSSELIIPVDPEAPNAPNLTVTYRPFANKRWTYWKYDCIAVPGVDAPMPENLTSNKIRSNKYVSNYSGQHVELHLSRLQQLVWR